MGRHSENWAGQGPRLTVANEAGVSAFVVAFGAELQRIRLSQGLRVVDVAEECGVMHTSVLYAEKGQGRVAVWTVVRICRALGVPFSAVVLAAEATVHTSRLHP